MAGSSAWPGVWSRNGQAASGFRSVRRQRLIHGKASSYYGNSTSTGAPD